MQIQSNGKRNITLDYELPKKFRLSFNGVDVPYLRTGKNSIRLSKDIDGLLDVEELQEAPQKIVRPMQLQPQQMALVNPADVIAINQAAQQLEIEQNILNENQKRFENAQNYINIQQEQINQAVMAVNDLETNNEQRISKNEQAIFNLAGEIARVDEDATNNSVSIISELESHKTADNPHNITKKTINLENVDNTADIDKPISKAMAEALNEKADKEEVEQIREEIAEYQNKTEKFNDAIANYTGGIGGNELPIGGFTGQVLAKKSDISGDYEWIDSAASVGEGILTIQKNGTDIDTFSANAKTNKTINIVVPTQASDINAMPDSVKYGSSLSMTIDNSTFVVTAQLKDQDNNNLGSSQTIDLPLESVVVNGSYDSDTKKVILTLQNGNTIEFSVADLVAGLQSEITESNKLDADLVDDSTSSNKFVTSSEKNLINSSLQPNDNISELVNDSGYITSSDLSTIEIDIGNLQDANKVINVVSTYAELQSYNTSSVTPNSIIKVIADENNSGKTSWYKWESQGGGTAFVQPTLTADGTIGGASFAVAADSVYIRNGNPDYAWHAFDGRTNVSTAYPSSFWNSGNGQPHWIEFYNPEPLTVTNIKIYNGESGSVAKDWQFQYSDNGSTWTTLTSGTNTTTGQGADWSFSVPNSGRHKYYRFYTTLSQGQYPTWLTIAEIEITATEGGSYSWVKVNEEGKYATETWVGNQGYLTGIDSSDVTTALGYTPVNPSSLATVATSGSYNDLLNKPTIPTVNNATLTIQKNSTNVATFTANASSNVTANITVPTKVSDLSNDSGFITGITSGDVTTALGYTPANDSNVVKTSGNQTIAGGKTLSDNLTIQRGAPNIHLKDTSITKGTAPSSVHYSWYGTIYDSQGINQANKMSQIYTQYNTNGSLSLVMNVFKPESGSTTSAALIVGYDENGNVYTSAPTPATSDNSTKIATTAYVKAQGYKTSVSSSDVTNALGYTPYDSSNPSGYLTATQSKSGDGYVKLSNGIIIQWGSLSGGTTTETLPTPFTTTDYRVVLVASPSIASATYNAVLDGDSLTTTSFSIGVSSNVSVRWIAIGW